MSFDPILNAPLPVQIHAVTAVMALLIGPLALYRRRRDLAHKLFGYLWVLSMSAAALSSFLIHSLPMIGPFSPIHGLAILALWSVARGVAQACAGKFHRHAATFRSLYWHGLIIAGLLNFLPGRISNRMVFGINGDAGSAIVGLGLASIFAAWVWRRARNANLHLSA